MAFSPGVTSDHLPFEVDRFPRPVRQPLPVRLSAERAAESNQDAEIDRVPPPDADGQREGDWSSGHLGDCIPLLSATDEVPVDVLAEFFASNGTAGFSLKVHSELFSTGFSVGHIFQVPYSSCTPGSQAFTLIQTEAEEIGFEIHGWNNTPYGDCLQHCSVNSPNGYKVVKFIYG